MRRVMDGSLRGGGGRGGKTNEGGRVLRKYVCMCVYVCVCVLCVCTYVWNFYHFRVDNVKLTRRNTRIYNKKGLANQSYVRGSLTSMYIIQLRVNRFARGPSLFLFPLRCRSTLAS